MKRGMVSKARAASESMQMTHKELEAELEAAFREGLEAFDLEAELELFGQSNSYAHACLQ